MAVPVKAAVHTSGLREASFEKLPQVDLMPEKHSVGVGQLIHPLPLQSGWEKGCNSSHRDHNAPV